MNYLAHIHLAHISHTSLLGNFLGDFVKGADLAHLPEELAVGIRLHRKIDAFTDQHPRIMQLKSEFPRDIRRMAGVVLDIYFDHLLTQHWQQFAERQMHCVLQEFYIQLTTSDEHSAGFVRVKHSLLKHRWLANYRDIQTCHHAFKQIEARLGHRLSFADDAHVFLNQHQQSIQDAFTSFYPELIEYVYQQTPYAHIDN